MFCVNLGEKPSLVGKDNIQVKDEKGLDIYDYISETQIKITLTLFRYGSEISILHISSHLSYGRIQSIIEKQEITV